MRTATPSRVLTCRARAYVSSDRRVAVAAHGDLRRAERRQQGQFPLVALAAGRKPVEQAQRVGEVAHRFLMRVLPQRLLGRGSEVRDRLHGVPGTGEVPGEQPGRTIIVRIRLLEPGSDPGVYARPLPGREEVVEDLPLQIVTEPVPGRDRPVRPRLLTRRSPGSVLFAQVRRSALRRPPRRSVAAAATAAAENSLPTTLAAPSSLASSGSSCSRICSISSRTVSGTSSRQRPRGLRRRPSPQQALLEPRVEQRRDEQRACRPCAPEAGGQTRRRRVSRSEPPGKVRRRAPPG